MIKTICRYFLSLFFVAGLFSATNVLAVPGNGNAGENREAKKADMQQKKDERVAEKNDNVCEKISERADVFGQKMTEQENNFQTRNQEKLTNWTIRKTENEAKLKTNQANSDANRDAQFKALEARAQTEEQKKSVTDFEVKVRAAIETRRLATDSAIKTFQASVQTAIATRKGQVDQLVSSTKTARLALLETAKADCAVGKDAKTVMATFRSGMQANRTKTQTDKQSVEKINATMDALIATRKTAIEKASTDFKATMEQARIELKKVFSTDSLQ
ncbi:MAG: hypothetical protein WCK16_04835 [Candidatus Moraniibacteriota bacterium]